ncbi:MAG: lipoprotein-releasing ABC transporter permease subunit [Deltaproteobacteria bacterium]|nr:MAG: lipoprotein-releasing ABC transporter permease subunit [Deltaproteobacteria bacterium]
MRYELFISLRYLRAKRREAFISLITAIAMIGVMIGVMTLNIVLSVMTGFEEDLRDRILGFNPHIVLSSLSGATGDYNHLVEKARQVPGVVAAAPFIYSQVMVTSRQSVAGVLVRGLEPALASDVVDVVDHLKNGTIEGLGQPQQVTIRDGAEERTVTLSGIIIGQELARQLGVIVGDPINVISPLNTTPGPLGMVPKVKRFVVTALFDSGMYNYDEGLMIMSLADAQSFFGLGERVTGIEVRVQDVYAAQAIARRLEATLGFPYRARDWTEINRNLFAALALEKTVYFIVLLLIVLVAAFNIIATLIMVVMEKRKDIAVLKSMGATSRSIGRIFVYKGLIIGVIGTLLGTLFGYGGCWLLDRYHFIELPKDVFYVSTLPVKIYPENFLMVGAASVVICLLATIYPARQAAGLAPVEVIRYE